MSMHVKPWRFFWDGNGGNTCNKWRGNCYNMAAELVGG